jgi:hypothetical protein
MLRRRFGIVVVAPVGAGGCDDGGGTLVAVPTSTDSGATFVVLRARFVGDCANPSDILLFHQALQLFSLLSF